jgi:predicted dienelactone hydrolase
MKQVHLELGLAVLLCACTPANKNVANNGLGGQASTTFASGGQPAQGGAGIGTGVTPGTGSAGSGTTNPAGGTAGTAVSSTAGQGGGVAGQGGTAGAGGTAGMGGAAGSAGATGTGGTTAAAGMGCGSTKLLAVPDDVSLPGPWPVGVKTLQVPISGGMITAEIWYPAPVGMDAGKTKVTYDLGDWTGDPQPIAEADKVIETCNCYRDLPIDTAYGPYPAVIFIHGTGSFRTASLSTMTQWASRGFVVVAADHPGLFLSDVLACKTTGISQSLGRDVDAMIAGMTNKSGDFAFLGSSVDMSRIGLSGHSAGAEAAAQYGNKPNVQVDMPLADYGGDPVSSAGMVQSVLIVSGMSDSVVSYSSDQSAYLGSPSPKRLVGITGGDHIDVTDLCWLKNSKGKTGIQVASDYQVCGGATVAFLATIAQCGTIDPKRGSEITNYVTTAALEETLHCANRDAAFAGLQAKYPEVGDFQHTP